MGFAGKRISRDQHLERVALANAGHSVSEIARRTGVSESAIIGWAKRHDISLSQQKEAEGHVATKRMALLVGGASMKEALEACGVRGVAARSWACRQGVSLQDRPLVGLTDQQRLDVVTLVLRGGFPLAEAIRMATRPKTTIRFRVSA